MALFLAKTGWDRQRKREKKFSPEFFHTRPEQENYEKNSEKIQKIKKPLSGIIFSQNGLRYAEKERKKKFSSEFVHTRPGQEKSEKNSKKIQKIKKPLFGIILSQNRMR